MVLQVSVKNFFRVPNINPVLGFPVLKLLRSSILVSLPAYTLVLKPFIIGYRFRAKEPTRFEELNRAGFRF